MAVRPLSLDLLSPQTSPQDVARLLQQPAVDCMPASEWWTWPNVLAGFQLAVKHCLHQATPFPPAEQPRGIVIVGGGKYLPSVYVTVRVLRHVGCRLPIEVWHFDDEVDADTHALIERHDVTFVNADRVAQQYPFRFLHWHWWKGWQLKSFALLRTRFREVLLLDADCYPTRDPEYLFDWPEYQKRGVCLWPDLENSPTVVTDDVCDLFQINKPTDRLTESGQMLVDRQASWPQLQLAGLYNQCADITYRYVWGDKDTFPFAWQRTGKKYSRMWPSSRYSADCMLQHDFNGHVVFQHRVGDKFKVASEQFDSTTQRAAANRYHDALAYESFCHYVLQDLKELHTTNTEPPRPTPAAPQQPPCSIQDMYPPVPVTQLIAKQWQQQFATRFLDTNELAADPFSITEATTRPHSKCVSVTLFKQCVDNRRPHEFQVDDARWYPKYWNGLIQMACDMADFPDWKLRIYVEPSLWKNTWQAFASHPQIELRCMASDSVGACPGSLWRFLALTDRSQELVLATDIDERLPLKKDFIRSFTASSAALGRLAPFCGRQDYLVARGTSDAKNYTPIIGSHVMARPDQWHIDLPAAMRGFLAYRRAMSRSKRPWAYSSEEPPSGYNRPVGDHLFGWGSHWYMYCFDERFLKHVLYYHFADVGELHSWAPGTLPQQLSPETRCDLEYTQAHGNSTDFPDATGAPPFGRNGSCQPTR